MWKNRGFLKGLGTGFIVAAILLQLMNTVYETDKRIQDPTRNQTSASPEPAAAAMDAKTIKERASALGLQVFDKDVKLYKQAEVDELVKKAAANANQQAGGTPDAPSKVTVFIYEGMNATNVADYLSRSGVVTDRTALEQELAKNQLASKIRSDLYTFHLNEPIQQVITTITTPQPR